MYKKKIVPVGIILYENVPLASFKSIPYKKKKNGKFKIQIKCIQSYVKEKTRYVKIFNTNLNNIQQLYRKFVTSNKLKIFIIISSHIYIEYFDKGDGKTTPL